MILWTKLVEVIEFQLSYSKSWKIMLWKCCTQYASKLGKLSSGHRTGKGQFSFQSQRKAMPKNAQTTAQLHSSHMLVKWCSKFSKPGFNSTWTHHPHQVRNVPDFTEPWWTFLWPQNTGGREGTLDKAGWIPKPASPPFFLISGPTLHGSLLLLTFPRGTILRLIERHIGKEADAERNTPHRRQMKIIRQKVKTIKQVMLSACLTLHKPVDWSSQCPAAWLVPARCPSQAWRVKESNTK